MAFIIEAGRRRAGESRHQAAPRPMPLETLKLARCRANVAPEAQPSSLGIQTFAPLSKKRARASSYQRGNGMTCRGGGLGIYCSPEIYPLAEAAARLISRE